MKKLFHNYRREYEMSVAVMGAMAEEIVNLRKDKETLAGANVELQKELADIFDEQNETIACLHEKIRKARAILEK